jgi:hypothetical protein
MTDVTTAPTTPAEATERLEQLGADPAWRDQFLAGNGPQKAEFQSLTELAAKGDSIDAALAGRLLDAPIQPSTHVINMGVAAALKDAGLADDVIRQTLSGHQVTQQEYDLVARWKQDRFRDKTWVQEFLSGSREHQRDMTLADIVLSSSIKKEAAA